MKAVKTVVSVLVTLFFSACMFFCFMAGAPGENGNLNGYTAAAGVFSILMPAFACVCVNYILHLQKRIEKLENNGAE